MSDPTFKRFGTVSKGASLNVILIMRFLEVLKELNELQYWAQMEHIVSVSGYLHVARTEWETNLSKFLHYYARETQGKEQDLGTLMEDLIDVLDQEAPDGYYFGTLPGDPDHWGFWSVQTAISSSSGEVEEVEPDEHTTSEILITVISSDSTVDQVQARFYRNLKAAIEQGLFGRDVSHWHFVIQTSHSPGNTSTKIIQESQGGDHG